MLVITRTEGQSFKIGDNIEIYISDIKDKKAKIAISAPKDVKILRTELISSLGK
ncbi:MAG: carbon storage regulator [Nitrincola sp.]|nr:carbon storage regulator [Nitrincola sp.]